MLSNESKQIFEILKFITGEDGNFKIIEAEEILEKLHKDQVMTKLELSATIRDLRDRDYLKVKYFTPDEYCLLTLRRSQEIQSIVEEVTAVATIEKANIIANSMQKNKTVKRGFVFLFAFLGAFLGSGIVTAIAVLLQLFLVK